MNRNDPAQKELKLRVPEHLHTRLKELATRDHRTLNGQVTWYLERDVKAEDTAEQKAAG
jgi:predicted HicB family RNase H-like nuclease